LSLEVTLSGVAIAETSLALSTQQLLFAGQPVSFRTNSSAIARYAGEFLSAIEDSGFLSTPTRATITVYVRETDDPCESAPWFRARGHFAVARFTLADSFCFNLRTREVYGTCSPSVAEDRWRWCAHIFPTLLGILSAVIDVAPVHAACLAREGRGILLAGQSGVGKSTLTIATAKREYALLSDDWTYLSGAESQVEAWGLPVPVKLLPDAAIFFPALLAYRPGISLNGETAYEVCPNKCFGASRMQRCPVTAVALLQRMKTPGCKIVPISAAEAISHLVSEIEPLDGSLASSHERQIDLIRRAVGGASCCRVSFNDHPDKVAAALDEAFSGRSDR